MYTFWSLMFLFQALAKATFLIFIFHIHSFNIQVFKFMFFHLVFTFNIISSIENYFLIVLVNNNNTFGFNSVSCKV